jgi:outer membrane protein
MNIPYDKNMNLERIDTNTMIVLYENTADAVYQSALLNFSQVKAMDLRKHSAESAVKVARGKLYPELRLLGAVNTNYSSVATQSTFINTTGFTSSDYVVINGIPEPVSKQQSNYSIQKIGYADQLSNNLYSSIRLNLSIPIFNNGRAKNQLKQSRILLRSAQLELTTVKTQLQQDIEQAYSNMVSAFKRQKTLSEQVESYAESFRAAEVRFNNGVGNSIDYLTAKNNLDKARSALISAKYDYLLRVKVLDFYQGKKLL